MTEYPWFKHYDAGVPRTREPYPDITLFEDVAAAAKERPGLRMIWFRTSIRYSKTASGSFTCFTTSRNFP